MLTDLLSMENLIELQDVSEAGIAKAIHQRFNEGKTYTNICDVLISLNNFSGETRNIEKYNKSTSVEADIFSSAENAYNRISNSNSTLEAIVFCGESGSGKSFNVFETIKYLSSKNSKLNLSEIYALKTVLQSFGCAKTLKNEIATRYGCSYDLLYQKDQLAGINIKYTAPLEVTRVIGQKPGERNFNIFYEIYHGLNDDAKSSFGIRELQKFFYLNQGNPSDNIQKDEDRFDAVDNALNHLGFSEEHRLSIYKIISTILHIGNIYFRAKRNPNIEGDIVEIGNPSEIKWIAFLMEVDYDSLVDAILPRFEDGSTISLNSALDRRDSLAMVMYEELFKWIISRINVHFKCSQSYATISVFDHYGIEKYNNNGLEEFLINSVNERIENIFVKHIFHDELVAYLKDEIDVEYKPSTTIENGKHVDLLFKKPYGLLSLLTDECKFPKGTSESYLQNCNLNHMDRSSYAKPRSSERVEFGIRQRLGTTWYSLSDFVRKNKRSVGANLLSTFNESRNAIMSMIFGSLHTREGSELFVSQAQLIIKGSQEIADKINQSHATFVRCLRSNNERLPKHFDIPTINRQIKSLLLSEILNFRLYGYPVKVPKRQFAREYRCLLPGDIAMCQKEKEIIQDILQGQGVKHENDFKIGKDYVFIRERLANRLRKQQFSICHEAAILIQKTVKAFLANKKFQKQKMAIIKLQAGFRGWRARRDYIIKREEMFKTIGRTVKRNKRLEAYHQALEGGRIPENLEPTTPVGYIDVDAHAKKILEKSTSNGHSEATQLIKNYITIPIKTFLPNMKSVSLEEYAEENFKGHLLQPRREPIMTPFLHKETEHDFRLSVEIFKLILKYMNDRKLSNSQRNDLGRYIVEQGILNPCQRDEIMVQIINQINNNSDKIAVEHGWRLVHMAISVFPPTENIIPMMIGVFNEQPCSLKEQLFSTLQRRLRIYDSEISREHAPSNLELHATPVSFNTSIEVNCYDGFSYDIHAHPWITTNEIAERILKQRGVGIPLGWTVEVETPNRIFAPTGTHFIHDVFSEINEACEEYNRSVFFNFPPEKLFKKTEKETSPSERLSARNTPTPKKEYPPPEEWMRQPPNPSRLSVTPTISETPSLHETPALSEGKSSEVSSETSIPQKLETEYTSILPKKKESRDKDSVYDGNYSENEIEHQKIENFKPIDIVHDNSHVFTSPMASRKPQLRNNYEEYKPINFAPPPTFTYPQQYPMMQYVPVMVTQPMVTAPQMAMIPQPMMIQPQYPFSPTYSQVPHYGPAEPLESILSPETIPRTYNMNHRNDGNEATNPRFRKGEVPSQYSTIRNMPVPENSRDVDQFLDAVFDQVLSKDEQRAAEINSHMLADTIKGGRNDARPEAAYYDQEQYPHVYRSNTIQQYHESPIRTRARSLPRHMSPRMSNYDSRPHSRNSYSAESSSSDDQTSHQVGNNKTQMNSQFDYNSRQPVYLMPVQMNANGEMVILSPAGQEYLSPTRHFRDTSRNKSRAIEKHFAKRSPSVDGYSLRPPMIRRTPDGIERFQLRTEIALSPKSRQCDQSESRNNRVLRSSERMEPPIITRQIPPRLDYHPSNVSYRSRSPRPAENKGLNRVPIESYTEPIVKYSTTNGEYLNPHKFNVDEQRAIIKAERETKKDAIYKLNQQLKKVPPPIDNVTIIRPKKKTEQIQPTPVPQETVVNAPAPVITKPTPTVEETWVIKDSILRPPENQEVPKETRNLSILKSSNEKPAIKYVKAPWKLTIRKEMFYPGETLNDIQIIDQVFAQIIDDCRKSNPYRIRLQDKKQIEDVLRSNNVPPSDLNNQTNIHPDVKIIVIEKARSWPLYFNQIYEVIEKRTNESVSILFAISENGIRLLIHTPHDLENPLRIQDYFPFDTLVDVSLEANDILAIHVKLDEDEVSYYTIRVKTNQAVQIKKTLEKCITGRAVPKRRLVKALEDYVTIEDNHLSFKRGDIIELLPMQEDENPPVGDWLYGRIENRFGYLLAQYVDSNYSENVQMLRFDTSKNRNDKVKLFDDEVEFSSEHYSMLNFAKKYFRQQKNKKRPDDWTWSEIAESIKFTHNPIPHSLLGNLSVEEDKNAVDMFQAIMKFMGDEPLKKSESITDVVFKLLIICHRYQNLRDELYCQLIKQTTSNTSSRHDSCIKGWRLFSIVTAFFPSTLTLQPYILQYLSENADDIQRQYHEIAQTCQFNIHQTFRYGGRKVLLNALEVQQTTDGRLERRQQFFITKDNSVNQNLRSVTVAEEVIQELCNFLNVRSIFEQQEFSLCYSTEKEKKIQYCKNDDYIMDIITEMEHKKLSVRFYLKRTVWVHPLRFDNTAYIDSMFDQIIDDYLRGSIINTNKKGNLTALTTEEVIKIGAFLQRLQPDKSDEVKAKRLQNIVPQSVLEPKGKQQEELASRINKELRYLKKSLSTSEIKAKFLEIVSTWALFGISHYRIKSLVEDGIAIPEVVLSIGKRGIQLLKPKSQEVFKQYGYEQISLVESLKTQSYKYVQISIGKEKGELRILDLKTEDADEIAHLIGQYLCVVTERENTNLAEF